MISHRIGGNQNVNTINECSSKIVRNRVLIAICRLTGDKWQLKTLFIANFDQRFCGLRAFLIAAYPV